LKNKLRRPDPEREQKKSILIALEDEKSSRLYFEALKREVRSNRIVVIAEHAGSAPKSVIEAAKKAKNDRELMFQKDIADRFDEVWVVFDTEGPGNKLRNRQARDAIEQARQLKFHTSVSNPCFEYWLILHFEYFVSPIADSAEACKRLKKHIQDYHKNRECYLSTRSKLKTAIIHSKRVRKERCEPLGSHPCDCHPSTEIDLLVASLLGEN
jgi:hypothetical protein